MLNFISQPSWLKSYYPTRSLTTLSNFTNLWGITNISDEIGLEHGVPQGSILCSLLSIVMVNKLPSFVRRVHKYTIGAICCLQHCFQYSSCIIAFQTILVQFQVSLSDLTKFGGSFVKNAGLQAIFAYINFTSSLNEGRMPKFNHPH